MITGISFIDVWTLPHLAFWIFFGSCLWVIKETRLFALLLSFAIAIGWEAFERIAEKEWPRTWLNTESFVNAWISDPLTAIIGIVIIYKLLDRYAGKRDDRLY